MQLKLCKILKNISRIWNAKSHRKEMHTHTTNKTIRIDTKIAIICYIIKLVKISYITKNECLSLKTKTQRNTLQKLVWVLIGCNSIDISLKIEAGGPKFNTQPL